MTKTIKALLALIAVLLFAVGLLVGQQTQRLKYEKYLRPGSVTPMDISMLRVNLEIVREEMKRFDIPTVYYKPSCGCFVARSVVTDDLMKQSIDEVRKKLLVLAFTARGAVEWEFPELPKWGAVPDRDFKMTFFELNVQEPDGGHDVAEYADGKIVFK